MADSITIAAVGDIHVREGDGGLYRDLFADISRNADILVLAGDLTGRGLPTEGEILAEDLRTLRIPAVAVMGNHDYESGHEEELKRIVCQAGLIMLEDEPHEVLGVGFAGVKGFAGGFGAHMLAPFGEPDIKDFVRATVDEALRLESGLLRLRTRHKVAVLHYSPIRETVVGEPPEIYPFLGSSRLEEPIDRFSADVVFHGHAHHGSAEGATVKGIPVYNVSHGLMRELDPDRPYKIVRLGSGEAGEIVEQVPVKTHPDGA